MSTINVNNKLNLPYLPGLLHHNSKGFTDIDGDTQVDQNALVDDMMKKSGGGMLGEKGQELGIFQRAISYSYMAVKDMSAALAEKLSPEQEESIKAFNKLVGLGLRPSKTTIDNWIGGYYGAKPGDIPPTLQGIYNYEKMIWGVKEAVAKNTLENPQGKLKEWMDKLNVTPNTLGEALVNPFQMDEDVYISEEVLLRMKDLGLFKLKIPAQYGGLGFKQKEYDKVLRNMIHTMSGALGGIVSAHSTIGSTPLVKYGTEAQREYYLPRIAKGEGLCAFGLTEPESGTDAVDKAETTAAHSADGKDWILNGRKVFITNAHRSSLMFIMAKVDDGSGDLKPTVFIKELPFRISDTKEEIDRKRKELEKEGIYISNPLLGNTIRGSNQAYIEFHNAKIPTVNEDGIESILGGKEAIGAGAKIIFNSLNAGRAGFGTFSAEAASEAFNLALIEAVQRKRFDIYGGTLADLPKIKKFISEMAIKVSALNAATEMTTALVDKYPNMNIIAEAEAIKIFATEEAWDIVQTATKMFGGQGTMKGQAIELMFRDLWIPLIVEGVNDALRQHMVGVASRPALKDSTSLGGMVRLMKSRFHYEQGDLGFMDALRVQRATKKVSFSALNLGRKYQKQTILKQNELIKLADRIIEQYVRTSAMLKLKNPTLPLKERAALDQYVNNVQSGKREYPTWIADLYIDEAKKTVVNEKKQVKELIEASTFK